MSHLFSLSRYQTKYVIKFLFRPLMTFKIFLKSTSKAMADREKKGGRQKYKKLNISRTRRAF